ncbi:Lipoteichoic acid synthase 1, partial [termite gut metagenome]
MKSLIRYFLKTYLLFVLVFLLQKPLFMWFYHDLFAGIGVTDYWDVMWHGLPLDLSIAGY